MNEQELLKIVFDEKGNFKATCPDKDKAIIAIVNQLRVRLAQKQQDELDFIFAIIVHLLASDPSGEFERQFIDNLRKSTPQYREIYRQMERDFRKEQGKKPLS